MYICNVPRSCTIMIRTHQNCDTNIFLFSPLICTRSVTPARHVYQRRRIHGRRGNRAGCERKLRQVSTTCLLCPDLDSEPIFATVVEDAYQIPSVQTQFHSLDDSRTLWHRESCLRTNPVRIFPKLIPIHIQLHVIR